MTKATLKWFNARKGYGFVTLEEDGADAFIHVSVLQEAGYQQLMDGSVLECEITDGPRGVQVGTIQSVEFEGAPVEPGGPPAASQDSIDGTVKWFNKEKGFGFVAPDGGGKDIFVHVTAVERSGIGELMDGQRVRVAVITTPKGPQAEMLEVVDG